MNQSVQAEIPQELKITRTGIEDVEQAVAGFLELKAEAEKDSQEGAIKVSTCAQINYKAANAVLK
jgi:hypothetical protein